MEPEYDNLQLSRDYIRVTAQHVSNTELKLLVKIQADIRGADVDIPARYTANGDLHGLLINGHRLTDPTTRALELILELGVEKVEKIVEADKVDEIRKYQHEGAYWAHPIKKKGVDGGSNPSWENVVRLSEE
ncbi:MAG: hypothetical protein AABX51_01790 [Nanoarchaeota archaeon]